MYIWLEITTCKLKLPERQKSLWGLLRRLFRWKIDWESSKNLDCPTFISIQSIPGQSMHAACFRPLVFMLFPTAFHLLIWLYPIAWKFLSNLQIFFFIFGWRVTWHCHWKTWSMDGLCLVLWWDVEPFVFLHRKSKSTAWKSQLRNL